MTDTEAVTVRNVLEDFVLPGVLQTACARLTRSSTTHTFTTVLTPEGLLTVLVRPRA